MNGLTATITAALGTIGFNQIEFNDAPVLAHCGIATFTVPFSVEDIKAGNILLDRFLKLISSKQFEHDSIEIHPIQCEPIGCDSADTSFTSVIIPYTLKYTEKRSNELAFTKELCELQDKHQIMLLGKPIQISPCLKPAGFFLYRRNGQTLLCRPLGG